MILSLPRFDLAAGAAALIALALPLVPQATPWLPWVKALPALIWAVSFLAFPRPGRWILGAALIFASLGDFLLAEGNQFFYGVVSFALFQGLCGVRFWWDAVRRPHPRRGLVVAPGAYALATILLLTACLPRVGSLALPMALYGLLLTAMASGAMAAGKGWKLAWGGALFYISDACILTFRAWPVPFSTDAIILIPYYLGLYLIARGFNDASPSLAYR